MLVTFRTVWLLARFGVGCSALLALVGLHPLSALDRTPHSPTPHALHLLPQRPWLGFAVFEQRRYLLHNRTRLTHTHSAVWHFSHSFI
ncbi:hypothetical protein F7734_52870 [Scytonema sp. UIC 10036]|uniref:hypothetical protein n=1 Tax=Scytonema sp. UIC 10036 TaxID=2304196 RepID=UPI0012DAE97F|nr:hypothetical protein [Scytonema sp. UIC 10036]MUH00509.1 hypothetical protein [Scytonema sp. UIC 10036]